MPAPKPLPPRIFKLKNGIQSYEWGKRGSDSLVGRLATGVPCNGLKMDETQYYAELWVGTHPNAPSYGLLECNPSLLSDLIAEDPTLAGPDSLRSKFPALAKGQLPFLLKVLSCRKALPLQAHPDKELAKQLFNDKSKEDYVDDNHKPEIAVSVESFEGFVGFQPHPQIRLNLEKLVPRDTLERWLGGAEASTTILDQMSSDDEIKQKSALKQAFGTLLLLDKTEVAAFVKGLQATKETSVGSIHELVHRLNEQYPGDAGVVCTPLFLNYTALDPGQAVFAEADGIHAWLSGDIIECMAASDNVVNAAFAPKDPKDVELFRNMLTYRSQPIDSFKLKCTPFPRASSTHSSEKIPGHCRGYTTIFDPPLAEFSLLRCKLPFEGAVEVMEAFEGPSIIVTVRGEGQLICDSGWYRRVEVGESWFIAAWTRTTFKAGDGGWEFYRAFVEA